MELDNSASLPSDVGSTELRSLLIPKKDEKTMSKFGGGNVEKHGSARVQEVGKSSIIVNCISGSRYGMAFKLLA